jgi:hypothetical protein
MHMRLERAREGEAIERAGGTILFFRELVLGLELFLLALEAVHLHFPLFSSIERRLLRFLLRLLSLRRVHLVSAERVLSYGLGRLVRGADEADAELEIGAGVGRGAEEGAVSVERGVDAAHTTEEEGEMLRALGGEQLRIPGSECARWDCLDE